MKKMRRRSEGAAAARARREESGPFVEHVERGFKRALYSGAVFHFINVRLTKGLIKALGRRIGAGSPICADIITPYVTIGIRTATRFARFLRNNTLL